MPQRSIDRRAFLQLGTAAVAGLTRALPAQEPPEPSAAKLPRWRGFNLIEKFTQERNAPFRESDFEWMARWGFDFARLPMSYTCWSSSERWRESNERVLEEIDQAVEYGRQHNVHVNLNLHRAPGYCVNPPKEPFDLWTDAEALEATCFHWAQFARRYRGIPNARLSFDLLNEPADLDESQYVRVVKALVAAIRAEDPRRLIIADGLRWGRDPVVGLADLGVAQSTRGYDPMRISHHRASWIGGADRWPEPSWPLTDGDTQDRAWLRRTCILPWQELARRGVGVHVGECGCHNRTPHAVGLAWMKDFLELWQEAGWGWALWNFRGSFGILDSGRQDVAYESFEGHQLDRRLLELLRSY
jgi:endoglucanase